MIRIPIKKVKKPTIYNIILVNIKYGLDLHVLTETGLRFFQKKMSWATHPLPNSLLKKMNNIPIPKAVIPFDKLIISFGVKTILD